MPPTALPIPAVEGVLLGVLLSAFGSTLISLGLNVEKLSLIREVGARQQEQRIFYRQPTWLAGFAVFIAGNVVNFLALAHAPASLLAPLGALSIVANGIFAWLILGELFTLRDVVCSLIICGGALSVVGALAPGDHSASNATAAAGNSSRPPAGVLAAAEGGAAAAAAAAEAAAAVVPPPNLVACFTRTAFVIYGSALLSALFWARMAVKSERVKPGRKPYLYAWVSATYGSVSYLMSKCLSELLQGDGVASLWQHPAHAAILVVLIAAAVQQIKYVFVCCVLCVCAAQLTNSMVS
jgi:drug/metabolite transporter (DMT)-like permease